MGIIKNKNLLKMRLGAFCLLGSLLVSTTQAQTPPDGALDYKSCKACYDSDRSVCLTGHSTSTVKVDIAWCCPVTGLTFRNSNCWDSTKSVYCSSKTPIDAKYASLASTITNMNLLEVTCPSNDAKCPNNVDSIILVTDSTIV